MQIEQEINDEIEFIDKLLEVGINQSDLNKLKKEGITTVLGVQMVTTRNLLKIKGFSEQKVEKIKEASKKIHSHDFINGIEVKKLREKVMKISTGSKEFDQLLGGGIHTMSITEAFGEFRCGKTQLAHTLCVTCQMPLEMGGALGKAVYIDTEGTFRPDRITEIAERFQLCPESTLENIIYARAHNSEHQMELLSDICVRLCEEKFSIIVVDSIIALFRTDFSGRGELAERQQKLGSMLAKLTRIAEEFNVAVFLTNQMTSDPGALSMVADAKKPVGGHILAHASATRLYLRKGRAEARIVKIWDSPDVPEAEANFKIGGGGIEDVN